MNAALMSVQELFERAAADQQAGRLQPAEAACREILAMESTHAPTLHLMALIALQMRRLDAAAQFASRAIIAKPVVPRYHLTLGVILCGLYRLTDAEKSVRTALKLRPDLAEAHNTLGRVLFTRCRPVEAEAAIREAIRLRPEFPEAHSSLGFVLFDLRRVIESEVSHREALRQRPEFYEALNGIGMALAEQRRFTEAEAAWRHAIRLQPDCPDAHHNRAIALLLTGRLAEGWSEYEWRGKTPLLEKLQRTFTAPRWEGEPLGDRVLFVHAEQGLGDTLQFCRYLPLLTAAPRVIFEVQPPLLRLLSRLPGPATVIARNDAAGDKALPAFDVQCPLLGLPRLFGTTLETIPARVPYLSADPAEVDAWRQRLAALPGLRVGLVWSGEPRPRMPTFAMMDTRRSLALAALAPLGEVTGVSFVSLQKGVAAAQAANPPAGMHLTDVTAELHDMAATAALIETLDLVISVDTAVAHLAGALGKPVWLLNRFDTCWRWLLDREDSPWYPTLRQFRQTTAGDWQDVIARLTAALQRLAGGDRGELIPPRPPLLVRKSANATDHRPVTPQGQRDEEGPGTTQRPSAPVAKDTPPLTVGELLKRALRDHEAGRIHQAEAGCRQILLIDAQNADALHLLGVVARQSARLDQAADFVRRAIAVNAANADYHRLLGLILVELGRPAEAETSLRRALRLKPDYAEAMSGLGVAMMRQGRQAEAETIYRSALRLRPDLPDAHNNLAIILQSRGDYAESAASSREALRLRPDFPEALNTLGSAEFGLGQFAEAEACYREAFALKSDLASAHINLGNVLYALQRYAEAESSYRAALKINAALADAHASRGRVQMTLGRPIEAESSYREALRLKPEDPLTLTGLGNALYTVGRYADAEASYRAALRLDPEYLDAHGNLGRVLATMGRDEEADASYREVLRRRPDQVEAHTNRSMALLLAGRFEEGWKEYEWRWKTPYLVARARALPQPHWDGSAIGDRVLLVHAEQGLGDTLQFCRYAPLVSGLGRVIFEVPKPLLRLLSRLPGIAEVIAAGSALPAFDAHCPLLSLPRVMGTTLDTIPGNTPYLTADPAEVQAWRERLASLPGLRVGLVWAGDPRTHVPEMAAIDVRRSIALNALAPLAQVSGVSFVSLQKGTPAAQAAQAPVGMNLTDFTAELHDMAATAALIEALDLVISVDTSVAHLAGGLGKRTWLLNRYDTCWRWLRDRDDSPWYPTLRQFRQTTPGDWSAVIERVKHELQRAATRAR